MKSTSSTRNHRSKVRIAIAAILLPGVAACVLLGFSASIASSVEGNFDYMSEGPGAVDVLDQASLLFTIAIGLLIATLPGVVLLASVQRPPRAKFVVVVVVTILIVAFATYFASWMLSRP